jgi:hypothetical protein
MSSGARPLAMSSGGLWSSGVMERGAGVHWRGGGVEWEAELVRYCIRYLEKFALNFDL